MNLATLDGFLSGVGVAPELRGLLWAGVILLVTFVVAFVVWWVIRAVEGKLRNNRNLWDDVLIHAIRRPLYWYTWLLGLYFASEAAARFYEINLLNLNGLGLRFGFIVLLVWALLRFIQGTEELLVSSRVAEPMDYTTVSAIGKLARISVFVIAALVIIQNLGYSISGVLAFGGVGGIAVGFAAKDMLANFFGGAVVYMDKPFKVGEWIRSPDASIEGVVEHIGWRVTRIRTFELRPLYVPNSIFTTISVENPSRMMNRRIYEMVGVRYEDVDVVDPIVNDIRGMLEEHEDIDADQFRIVNFTAFNASSLDIMVYAFTHTREWVTYQSVKQDVMLRISSIIRGHGAEVAFPTRTLHIAGGGPQAVLGEGVAAEGEQPATEGGDANGQQ
ncbi:MAG: mechanosensitive ion channel family protein [Halospina sp.]